MGSLTTADNKLDGHSLLYYGMSKDERDSQSVQTQRLSITLDLPNPF